MAIASLLFFYLSLRGFVQVISGQRQGGQPEPAHAAGPWRHRIQWENNGQIHSLVSTGSEFQAPARVYVSSRTRGRGQAGAPRAPPSRRATFAWADGLTVDGSVPHGLREDATAGRRPAEGEPGHPSPFLPLEENPADRADDMFNDDSLQSPHGNSVLYNMYPPGSRSGARGRPPPDAGHGTRFFQNGLPDLVPDPYAVQAGAYIQRMQMFALRCAAEEDCLARSAYGPSVRDIDFRVLLRFPQKVKNQGTADFLPVKPRHQWDWHSCHQHYHSMEAFSNYDLLDAASGRKVAEGHKASFCLEDTACDAGFRRRYACTAHTQGLSPGCHDLYAANIDCQWIDITDVKPGNYVLKITVNPNFHVLESDFSNNIVRCDVTYTGVYVQTRSCRLTRS
ncbi:protein-lysine 6-oxidase-like [Syngnathoides biaculeatus]|uniref:protein-lysine 6-oxidase-like n=1 Tax=Syngnathoides biaculeatus TaxID=300417 RepID=UPI002ADE0C44|nr:protein-lysine 6-oxidase-like [Syngnathoides biaculeatus]